MVKRVAILANGGDVSGFNAVIRAIIKTAEYTGETVNMEIAIPNGALDLLTSE